jgi:hypothetical protein
MTKALTPKEVLVDLFGGADFDHEILDPEAAAELVIQHLDDSGFAIVPAAVGAAVEMHAALRAWFDCPRKRRPSPEALGERIAAIASTVP